MADAGFQPGRVRLARELKGWSQAELAKNMNLTAQAVSQFEGGTTKPGEDSLGRMARTLDVPEGFFYLPLVDTHEGFFRSLRRTSVTNRRRARAFAQVAHDRAIVEENRLPPVQVPQHPPIGLDADPELIESAASMVRSAWGVPRGPIPDVVALLEGHGIVVIRLPLDSADVDAFSLPFPDRPVVVLCSDKGDRGRSRFDAAHELGHLVLHGEQVWGMKEVETQAHRFAASFLMPKDDIYSDLPDRADWPTFFSLKRKWEVSIAALLRRALDLGKMSPSSYQSAMKLISARGWRRTEPVPLGPPEQPQLLGCLRSSGAAPPAAAALPPKLLDDILIATVG